MAYRSELAALESHIATLETELAEARRALNELKARDMLLPVTVARKCPADWNEMAGDARVRFCQGCRKNVYNLSAMSAAEANALIEAREGICVRLYRRADGTVLTSDCPGPPPSQLRALWRRVAVVAGATIAATAMAAALDAVSSAPETTHQHVGPSYDPAPPPGRDDSIGQYEMGDLGPVVPGPDVSIPAEDTPPPYWQSPPAATARR